MNYFARLAQRSGIAAPRGAAAPAVAAPEMASASTVVPIKQEIEVAAPAQPNALSASVAVPAHPAIPPPVMPAAPATVVESITIDRGEAVPPAQTATAPAPAEGTNGALREEERVVVTSAPAPLPLGPQPAADAFSPPTNGGTPPSPAAQQRQATSTSAIAPFEVEVIVPADVAPASSPAAIRQAAAPERSATPEAQPTGLVPPIDENIEIAAARVVPISSLTRDAREARPRPLERNATTEHRAHGEVSTRSSLVEVRIGTVTLQVHAAPPSAPAPVRNGFAPHRHYLRLW